MSRAPRSRRRLCRSSSPASTRRRTSRSACAGARDVLEEHGLNGEVVVADNGSDGRQRRARRRGRRPRRPRAAPRLRQRLPGRLRRRPRRVHRDGSTPTSRTTSTRSRASSTSSTSGAELVMGDRMDNIQPGAMPWLHRYVGNPILTGHPQPLLPHRRARRALRHARPAARHPAEARPAHPGHGVRLGDGHPRLQGEAARSPSSRSSTTRAAASRKLSSFRDGWRHLRFLLVHSPTHLFILPGRRPAATLGVLVMAAVLGAARHPRAPVGPALDDRRRLLLDRRRRRSSSLGLCAHAYGTYFMGERDPWFDRMRARFRLEHGLAARRRSSILARPDRLRGHRRRSGSTAASAACPRSAWPSSRATLIIVGLQVFFSSFLLSILGLRRIDTSR